MKNSLTFLGQSIWTLVASSFSSTSSSSSCPRTKSIRRHFLILEIFLTIFIILMSGGEILAQVTETGTFYRRVNKCCPIGQKYKENTGCLDARPKELMVTNSDKKNHFWTPKVKQLVMDPIDFRLNVSKPACSIGYIEKIIINDTFAFTTNTSLLGGFDDMKNMNISDQTVFLNSDGSIIWFDDQERHYRSTNFCIDKINEMNSIAVICPPDCSKEFCIQKCCPSNSIFDEMNASCVPSPKGQKWRPDFFLNSDDSGEENKKGDISHHQYVYIYGFPRCTEMFAISSEESNNTRFYPLLNGSLLLIEGEQNKTSYNIFKKDRFCIDGISGYDENPSEFSSEIPFKNENNMNHFTGLVKDQIAIICFEEDEDEDLWLYQLFASCLFISSFFLILTALLYLVLWEYKNIHGWLQFAYVVTLCFAFTSLAIIQLWLTSMNFDLWLTLRIRTRTSTTRQGERFKFTLFSLFSWGIPMIIASIGTILDFKYSDDYSFIGIRPKFEHKCYLFSAIEQLPYFYVPVGLLLSINCVFFFSTSISLHRLQKDTKLATRQSSNQVKKKFVEFMKLFIVSGILWVFEVISWAVINFSSSESERLLKRIFIPTDLLNAFLGLAIFIIFICTSKTCKLLQDQFKKMSHHIEAKKKRAQEDRGGDKPILSQVVGWLTVGLYSILLLPIVHGINKIFRYAGGNRPLDTRSFSTQAQQDISNSNL